MQKMLQVVSTSTVAASLASQRQSFCSPLFCFPQVGSAFTLECATTSSFAKWRSHWTVQPAYNDFACNLPPLTMVEKVHLGLQAMEYGPAIIELSFLLNVVTIKLRSGATWVADKVKKARRHICRKRARQVAPGSAINRKHQKKNMKYHERRWCASELPEIRNMYFPCKPWEISLSSANTHFTNSSHWFEEHDFAANIVALDARNDDDSALQVSIP